MSRFAFDDRAALATAMEMMAIPGKSGCERGIADYVVARLIAAGVPAAAMHFDRAHTHSPFGGEVGNLIVRLPGTLKGPRRLLMAHLDTVPLCVGADPVRRGDAIVSRNPRTALGGDDRGGTAVVLLAALAILGQQLPHPPLTLFFPVQEEVGLVGSRHVALGKLGNPRLCFNWDGGPASSLSIGATGADDLTIEVFGLASHAGAHPEDGISAIAAASRAIAQLADDGWHGLVVKGKRTGTSNLGYVHGGEATNVVLDHVILKGEARSHDPKFRAHIVETFRTAFVKAARATKNAAGQAARVEFSIRDKYESFRLDADEPCVAAAMAAVRQIPLEPQSRIINGGLDANWLTAHGLPTVTLGCGQEGIHTVNERLNVTSFLQACRIGLILATATESAA